MALRRHWTLNEVFRPDGFGAAGGMDTADQVQVFADGAWSIYWLYDENDGDSDTAHWVNGALAVDQSADNPTIADREMNLGTGFFGSRDFKTADSIFVWRADTAVTATGYGTYYLLHSVAPYPVANK